MAIQKESAFKLTYGLYLLTAKEGDLDNGCIVNTFSQLTDTPLRVSVCVNRKNETCRMIEKDGAFNVSVLTEQVPFAVIERFGFHSGRDTDKFESAPRVARAENGILYLKEYTNAFFSVRVIETHDYGTHILFVGEVTEASVLSDAPSVTYAYYFAHIKPKPQVKKSEKKQWICKICGYIYEGDALPDDFFCPICKHGASDFEPLPEQTTKKKWVCKICGYIYEGDALPDDFVCPICKHGASDFELLK